MKFRFLAPLMAASSLSLAHSVPSQNNPTTVDASLAATWRSANVIGDYDYWQIPGTMMGGEAWPAEKGAQIDELNLGVAHRIDENFYGVIKFNHHAGGDDDHGGAELAHAYVGWVCCDDTGPWLVEAGRMSAQFSPGLAQHSVDRLASESPLALDVLFGRDFHDDGLRFWWHQMAGFSLGAEVWKGKAFPATDTENGGAWDVFGQYQWQGERLALTLGGWFYSAEAESRSDHRYGGGHQHVPVAPPGEIATLFPDTRYTGETEIAGAHFKLGYKLNPDWALALDGEWMQAKPDGVVHDGIGREANFTATQQGGWLQPSITWRAHTFGLRAEQLNTDNKLTGAAAPQLAQDSGLANPLEHDPQRLTAIWRWQWRKNIAIRAEAVQDESLPEKEHRWNLGIVWKETLWSSKTGLRGHH
ncbi:MAG: hypothetical protein ACPH5V_00945 [Alcanivorax sp.]|jgi:hypothetical protein|uniref:hypothetical protein n=1 Tax=Alcanivorax borkumensis TaxID=59754 RepID=UPI0035628B38